jgi:hypothetical protein
MYITIWTYNPGHVQDTICKQRGGLIDNHDGKHSFWNDHSVEIPNDLLVTDVERLKPTVRQHQTFIL